MRKQSGFHLVEMIVVMAILPVVVLVTTPLFRVFALEIPQGHRMVEEHTVLLHMLDQLRTDVQSSQDIQVEESADPPVLTLQGQDTTWIYRIEPDGVIRTQGADDPEARQWRLPQANVQWSVLEPHAGILALQVESHIQDIRFGRPRVRLAQTHLFFMPSVRSAEVQP